MGERDKARPARYAARQQHQRAAAQRDRLRRRVTEITGHLDRLPPLHRRPRRAQRPHFWRVPPIDADSVQRVQFRLAGLSRRSWLRRRLGIPPALCCSNG